MPSGFGELTNQAHELVAAGDLAGAQELLGAALSTADPHPGNATPELAEAAGLQARVLVALGEPHSARGWAAFAYAAATRLYGRTDQHTVAAAATLAAVLHRVGSHARAARLYRDVILELTATDGPESLRVLAAHADLATVEYARGQCGVARTRLADAWELHREVYGDGNVSGIKMLARLGSMQRDCGRFTEAHEHLALARELCREHLPAEHPLAAQIAALARAAANPDHVCTDGLPDARDESDRSTTRLTNPPAPTEFAASAAGPRVPPPRLPEAGLRSPPRHAAGAHAAPPFVPPPRFSDEKDPFDGDAGPPDRLDQDGYAHSARPGYTDPTDYTGPDGYTGPRGYPPYTANGGSTGYSDRLQAEENPERDDEWWPSEDAAPVSDSRTDPVPPAIDAGGESPLPPHVPALASGDGWAASSSHSGGGSPGPGVRPVQNLPERRHRAALPVRIHRPPRQPARQMLPIIFAGLVVVLLGTAAVAAGFALNRPAPATVPEGAGSPSAPPADPAASPGAAPTGVSLTDNRDSVTLAWTYPIGAEGPVVVSGGRVGQEPRAFQELPAGHTGYVVYGLNSKTDYCFSVAVVYSAETIGQAEPVCTTRKTTPPAR